MARGKYRLGRSDAPQHRLAALIRRLLHPRREPDPDYLMEVQWDPYVESVVHRVSIDCE